jgi:hypothetical protein
MNENINAFQKKGLFKKPFKYAEGFSISLILIFTGFLIEYFSPSNGIKIPSAPYNVYIALGLITVLIFIHLFLKEKRFFKFLSSVPAAISAISTMTLIVLLLGLTPQVDFQGSFFTKIGLTHISKSWVMLLIALYFFTSLGLVTIRRATPFNKKNIGFLLNHFGLWLIIIAAVIGSGDLLRLSMVTYEGEEAVWVANDEENSYDMPVAIKLIDFKVDEYNPKLVLVDNTTGMMVNEDTKGIVQVEEGMEIELEYWKIKIDTLLKSAAKIENKWIEYSDKGAAQAVKFYATNTKTNDQISGWVSSGSFMMEYEIVQLDESYSLAMLMPEPEKFSSDVEVFAKDGTHEKVTIEVNKPYEIYGWKIYQLSYNTDLGRWSDYSVFELVRDPWLPVVYIGMMMVLAGSLYLFWIGKKTKQEPVDNV